MYNVISYYLFIVFVCNSKMAAIPMPRKISGETYDVDSFIEKLLASQKFDKLTEVFADKTAHKIKTLDPTPIDIKKKRWSKKIRENSDSESNSEQVQNPLVIDLPDKAKKPLVDIDLSDDDSHRKVNPIVYVRDGEIIPNEDLKLKYKYLTRNANKKNNSSNISKLKTKDKNEERSPINNETKDHETVTELKAEFENTITADENQNEFNASVENNHSDRSVESSKIGHEWVKEEHGYENTKDLGVHEDLKNPKYSQLHVDDNEKDATHLKTEHYAQPEFKTKVDSTEHETLHNSTTIAISEENSRDVISDEKPQEIDHIKEVTAKSIDKEENIEIQKPTTTPRVEETVTTNNTGQKLHADDDTLDTPHFRAHTSEESGQAKSDEKEREIRNLPDNELKYPIKDETNHKGKQNFDKKVGKDKTNTITEAKTREKVENGREDTLEKDISEIAKMEKIVRDRLKEEERLQEAAANYEKKEREQRAAAGKQKKGKKMKQPKEEIQTKLRENVGKYEQLQREIQDKLVNEKLKYEKMLMEETEKEEIAVREKGEKLLKERLQYEKIKKEAEKQERENIEREIKHRQDFEKEVAAKERKHEELQAEREHKALKEMIEFEKQLKEEALLPAKRDKERFEQLAKEKQDYVFQKKLKEEYSEYEDETDEEKKKDTERSVLSPPHASQEKKNPVQKIKELAYNDDRDMKISKDTFSKEKQIHFRAQTSKSSENQLDKGETDENEGSDESEIPTQQEQYVKSSKQTNNQLNINHNSVEDKHNNQRSESSDDDYGSENEGSTTIDPNMMRKEGNKVYAFVQDPEYAEYHEAYAKMQKEHPYNPADFM